MLVLSVSFSPALAELSHDVKDDVVGNGDQPTMSMVSALIMAIKAFKKNVTKEVAEMSGGEYTTFTGDKRFQQRVVDAAKHMRNRYLITFSPSDPSPGLHTIRVRTAVGLRSPDCCPSQLLVGAAAVSCFGAKPRFCRAYRSNAGLNLLPANGGNCQVGLLPGSARRQIAPRRRVHGNLTLDT